MIPHLIDGKPVESPSVLENINPATGEVLAEVALGGEREVALAVASAKEAFPVGRPAGQERARIMRRLGDLIERHVPELAELETDDTGLPIHQTSKQLIPRASENFISFRSRHAHQRPDLPGRFDHAQLHAAAAGGRAG